MAFDRMKEFKYVGPTEIMLRSRTEPPGTPVDSQASLLRWLSDKRGAEEGWATYVVNRAGTLLLAPRRSEHVACATGEPVLAAGEIRFDPDGVVVDVTNNSTGYCPSADSWDAVASALEVAGLRHPSGFTFTAVFRQCPKCGERNIVKEDWFVCALCDTDLPRDWNFGHADSARSFWQERMRRLTHR